MSGKNDPRPERSVSAAAITPVAPHGTNHGTNTKSLRTVAVQHEIQVSSGPLPRAEELAAYDRTLPGAANRIITMAEAELAHRHQQEALTTQANIQAQQRQLGIAERQVRLIQVSDLVRQTLGALISLAAIAGTIYLGIHGQTVAAGALAALPIVGVIRALHSRAENNRAVKKEHHTN